MRSYWSRLGTIKNGVLMKKGKSGHRHTGEGHVRVGVMLPEVQEPPEARREAGTDPSLASSEGAQLCQHLDLRLPGLGL